MRPPAPPRVDHYAYSTDAPPERSARAAWWVARFEAGWRPNKRVRKMGYDTSAEYFGVYIWEYINVLSPLMNAMITNDESPPRR